MSGLDLEGVLAGHYGWHYIGRDLSDETGARHIIECSGQKCRARLVTPTYGQQGDTHRAHVAAVLREQIAAWLGGIAASDRKEGTRTGTMPLLIIAYACDALAAQLAPSRVPGEET